MSDEFSCSICGRRVSTVASIRRGRRTIRARGPICVSCETVVYYTWHGGARRPNGSKIEGGLPGDRRAAQRLFAIADALEREAQHEFYRRGESHGRFS